MKNANNTKITTVLARFMWNKITIDLDLGGRLSSQMKGLFENKKENETRK